MSDRVVSDTIDGVIFLPGLMCDECLFEPQVKALRGRVETEVAYLGGHDTFEAMANEVFSTTKFDRFALAGLSMGGALAMTMARMDPKRVERLAILDANPGFDDDVRKANRKRQIEQARRDGMAELTRNELSKLYLAPHNQTPEFIDVLVAMAKRHGVETYQRQQNALMTRQGSRKYLPDYHGKSLVLCGELDILCLPQWHVEMAELLPNAHLVMVPDAGHITTLEAPGAVNAAIMDWLSD